MNRRLAIIVLLALPLMVVLAVSCGQQPAQLSPEDRARQTVTDFLEMCKQDQVREAVDTYVELSNDPQAPQVQWEDVMAAFFRNVADYRIGDATLNIASTPPAIWVRLDLTQTTWEGSHVQMPIFFPCSLDGSQLIQPSLLNVIDVQLMQSPENGVSSDSLDARISLMVDSEHVPGEVVVTLKAKVSEQAAYEIFATHSFDRQSVEKQYTPQMYVLHFSEDSRDIKSVIKELILDENVQDASPNIVAHASSWGTTHEPTPPTPRDIPFENIMAPYGGPSSFLSISSPGLLLITDRGEYDRVISEPVKDGGGAPEMVDFQNHVVLAICTSLPDPGYSFSVEAITQTGTEIEVGINQVQPDPETIRPMVVVNKLGLVLIDRASFDPGGELHFVLLDVNGEQAGEVIASV